MRRFFLIGCLLLISACASDPAKRQAVAESEVSGMQPTTDALSVYSEFKLLPMKYSSGVTAKPEKVKVAQQLENKLIQKLNPLLSEWQEDSISGNGRTLLLQPTVASLHVVSGSARFWIGALSGDSFINMDITITDQNTGKVIANQRINRNANAMTGAWSIGKSDRNLLDYIVDIAYQFLAENYKHDD